MHLKQIEIAGKQVRDDRPLVRAGGNHDISGGNRARWRLREEPLSILVSPQPRDCKPAADRWFDQLGISLQISDDLVAGRKPVRPFAAEGKIRQFHRPVRELEPEAIPALAAPSFGNSAALEHEMGTAAPAQHMAHGEPCLSAADNQRLHELGAHVASLSCGAPCKPSASGSMEREHGLGAARFEAISFYKPVERLTSENG